MPTLVLPPRSTLDTESLSQAARRADWDVWAAPGWRLPEGLLPPDPVLYTDVLFADAAATSLGLALLEPPNNWPAQIAQKWLGRQVEYTTLGNARQLCGWWFVKPADEKGFPARVYSCPEELPNAADWSDDTPVLVSPPVTWDVEYRCFVLDGKVVASSPYLRGGELSQLENEQRTSKPFEGDSARRFAQKVLADPETRLPPAFVLDVGRISEPRMPPRVFHGWAVVEPNAAWGSGLYGCDPDAVLSVLRRSCVPRSTLSSEDAVWARPFREVIG